MRATLTTGPALALALALLAASARAADDEVPSFKKPPEKDKEKEWVARVGTAVVKAARTRPLDVALVEYRWKDVRKGRKDLAITMSYVGAITKKKFDAVIVVHVDVSDDKEWEVLGIDYGDGVKISAVPPEKMRELIRKFNR